MNAERRIIPFEERHLKEASEIYNHYVRESTCTFTEHEVSVEEFREFVFFPDPRHGAFVIENIFDSTLLGYCVLWMYKPRSAYRNTAEVSVYLKPDYTGKGIGREALEMLQSFGKSNGMHALLAGICSESIGSIKLFTRMGYAKVGHLKEVGFKFGRRLDVEFYEKIL